MSTARALGTQQKKKSSFILTFGKFVVCVINFPAAVFSVFILKFCFCNKQQIW